MEDGTYYLFEDARTYFYPSMSIRVEGGKVLNRWMTKFGPKDEVTSADGHVITLHPGWTGVTAEGDEAPPTQSKVVQEEDTDGRVQEDFGEHL